MNEKIPAACIIGWPVSHSRSPLIHNYWIEQLGLQGEYRREAVSPHELANFLAHLSKQGYVGANVTLPHKEAALNLAMPDAQAKAVGAANTLWFDGQTLRCTNTDVEGFLANLDASAPHWDQGLKTAIVLGAGGAARAVAYGLLTRGVPRIFVVNRTLSRAEKLRDLFGPCIQPALWDEMNGLLTDTGLVVNTTALGMQGHPPLVINIGKLPADAVVADVVYAPLMTPLLVAAREGGLRHADGLGMLMHQAVGGFSLWFGRRPQVTAALRALLEADLSK
jgi:shikimate dehydrogenase